MRVLPCTLAGVAVLFSTSVFAATFNVDNTADIPDALPGDGKCSFIAVPPVSGACTLRAAIMEANATPAHDTIIVQGGVTYLLTLPGRDEDLAATGDLDITRPLTIRPLLILDIPVAQAMIDANGIDRVFDIDNVHGAGVTLTGLTLRGGEFIGDPAEGKRAGGINLRQSKGTLSFIDVSSIAGYGIHVGNNLVEETTISYSTIAGNDDKAAVLATSSLVTIESSSLIFSEGGVHAQQPGTRLTVNNSTVSSNTNSGIVVFSNAEATVTNSTIVDNKRGLDVGVNSVAFVENSVFSSNSIKNCLIEAFAVTLSGNLYDDDSCPSEGVDDTSLHDTPAFLSLLGYHGGVTPTHRPMTNSPLVDYRAGPHCDEYPMDQRLMTRKVSFDGEEPACDIGSVELETDVIYFDQFDRL